MRLCRIRSAGAVVLGIRVFKGMAYWWLQAWSGDVLANRRGASNDRAYGRQEIVAI